MVEVVQRQRGFIAPQDDVRVRVCDREPLARLLVRERSALGSMIFVFSLGCLAVAVAIAAAGGSGTPASNAFALVVLVGMILVSLAIIRARVAQREAVLGAVRTVLGGTTH